MVVANIVCSHELFRKTSVDNRKGQAHTRCCLIVSGEREFDRLFWKLGLAKFVNKDVATNMMDSSHLSGGPRSIAPITQSSAREQYTDGCAKSEAARVAKWQAISRLRFQRCGNRLPSCSYHISICHMALLDQCCQTDSPRTHCPSANCSYPD